ncbi:MAG: hypothetical protein AAGE80_17460 [Pseudomonadota bacterium]
MNEEEFKAALSASDAVDFCHETLFDDVNWYFENSDEVDVAGGYQEFREVVSEQIGVDPVEINLAGSSKYGFSLSPDVDKTFSAFHAESDLDLIIVSDDLFRAVWSELLEAYHAGYRWILKRHCREVFRKFSLLSPTIEYKTTLLRARAKNLSGISREIFLKTGSSRQLKYRIYESRDAAVAYHAAGLDQIKRRIEDDA